MTEKSMTPQTLRGIPELRYTNADNVVRYRAIMRFFYLEYKRLRYWLRPEEVHAAIAQWDVWPHYTQELCQQDLEQLASWQNLTSRHEGGRSSTLEEYLKKKLQYCLRPYSIEIERMLESLEKVTGYGGSLEASLFDTIADKLFAIRRDAVDIEPEAALQLWTSLYESFVKLHENAADYMASLHTAKAEEMMVTEAFLLFKEKLTDYLQHFVQALQRSSYGIEGHLLQIREPVMELFLERAAEGELSRPRLEEAPDKEELLQELRQGWNNIRRWFLGSGSEASELTMLERATKDAIARIVRSAIRIQERKRSGLSRKKELEHLAGWFARLETMDEAHRLGAHAFGLFRTRHLQGEDLRTTDRSDQSSWDEQAKLHLLRSRSRKRSAGVVPDSVPDHRERKQREREVHQSRQAEEWRSIERMLRLGQVSISELGPVTTSERVRLLSWIGRCMTAGEKRSFVTAEGVRITLSLPQAPGTLTVLLAEDGELEMKDYRLDFRLTEASLYSGRAEPDDKGDGAG
ncbi:TIGR02677 family protein [Paenibacillus albicereus]|uniref:TIGR02677 family protein n=1 Tax=Paenibacillus albicereus TaxID=2726185 RepID=A0A6H2GTD2_9BACL|nr:TIGR02677 family protein [Paenibacillus albicereus]QJC50408.1 TIGR02677 family protein [Paenibacillus albicereus]